MSIHNRKTLFISLLALSSPLPALEEMSNKQMGDVTAQLNMDFTFNNIQFVGTEIPGQAEAGSVNSIAADGSALLRKNYSFVAKSIGTDANPVRTRLATSDTAVNTVEDGEVTVNGNNHGVKPMFFIGLPEKSAWQNVDFQYDAVYENPTSPDPDNPNIAAGGTPTTEHNQFGRVTIDNLSITGNIGIAGIPRGYKIESFLLDDGSRGASSRQGFMMNVAIDELLVDQWLFETQNPDGVFDPERDMALNNFRLTNLNMKSATLETTPEGLRFAYHNPQPFTQDEGLLIKSGGGYPDTESPAYNPDFPKANLTFNAHVPHSLPNESRIKGVILDHMVFNLRND